MALSTKRVFVYRRTVDWGSLCWDDMAKQCSFGTLWKSALPWVRFYEDVLGVSYFEWRMRLKELSLESVRAANPNVVVDGWGAYFKRRREFGSHVAILLDDDDWVAPSVFNEMEKVKGYDFAVWLFYRCYLYHGVSITPKTKINPNGWVESCQAGYYMPDMERRLGSDTLFQCCRSHSKVRMGWRHADISKPLAVDVCTWASLSHGIMRPFWKIHCKDEPPSYTPLQDVNDYAMSKNATLRALRSFRREPQVRWAASLIDTLIGMHEGMNDYDAISIREAIRERMNGGSC